MYAPNTRGRRRVGLFNRPKPRRLKRGMVSLDDSLIAASARPAVFQPNQPLTRGLSVPLAPHTMVHPPVGGKPFVDRLDPKDVMAAQIVDPALSAVLLGFAQVKPEGAKKVVMTRQPSQDVVVRLYHETQNGLIFPTWVLARSHRQMHLLGEEAQDDATTLAEERKTLGMLFCQYVAKALTSFLRQLSGKPVAVRMHTLVRTLTGRNLSMLALDDKERAWEQLLNAICERRPVYATTKETNPQHQKARRFGSQIPITVLEAFELRGERYVCVYDPHGAAEGTATAPKDLLFGDLIAEVEGLYLVA
jgi:hypothetical protein